MCVRSRNDRSDQVGVLVSRVARGAVDLEPLERFGRFALVQHRLFGALLWCGQIQPFPGQLRRQDNWSPIVNIDHVPGAVGGNDPESVMLTGRIVAARELID